MAVTVKIDTKQFESVLKEYQKVNRREYKDIVNFKLKAIAWDAMLNTTRSANTSKMRLLFGQVATRVFGNSRRFGRVRLKTPRPVFSSEKTALHKIVIARLHKEGKKIPRKVELDRMVRKERGRRLSGAGFIKSGWLPAALKLRRLARGRVRSRGKRPRQYGARKGTAIPAITANKTMGAIGNFAITPKSKHSWKEGRPMLYASAGLRRAFNREMVSMLEYMRKKLQPVANRFSAR